MCDIYCIFQSGSNQIYRKGVIAICTSVNKAIKLIDERYRFYSSYLTSEESKFSIDGINTYFKFSDDNGRIWMKVEIKKIQKNIFIM